MTIALAVLFSSTAVTARVPLVQPTGIALSAPPVASAFCDASARALLLLGDGDLVAIDQRGSTTKLHAFGPIGGRLAMTCDRHDRIVIAGDGATIELYGAKVSTTWGPRTARAGRSVDADAAVFVEHDGKVWRWDGSHMKRWGGATRLPAGAVAIRGDGMAIAVVAGDHATIYMADGASILGPAATAVAWAPDDALLVEDPSGLSRWRPAATAPVDNIDGTLAGTRLYASDRYLIAASASRLDVRTIDATGQAVSPVEVTRVPFEASTCVFGTASFALVADAYTAWIADLSRSTELVGRAAPMDALRTLAFSSDGKSLAFLGGNSDVLVVATDAAAMNLRSGPGNVLAAQPGWLDAARIAWSSDDTIVAAAQGVAMRWRRTGAPRLALGGWTIGLTPRGEVIDVMPDRHVVVRRSQPVTILGSRDLRASIVAADLAGDWLAVREFKRIGIWDLSRPTAAPVVTIAPAHWLGHAVLVGTGPAAMFSDAHTVYRVDTKGTRTVDSLPGVIVAMAASPDRQRVVVGCSDGTTVIYDATGKQLLTEHVGLSVTALAWSPGGQQLAVATARQIELWSLRL